MAKESVYGAIFEDGPAYERFMGRWSRLTGQLFVDWLRISPHARWLDVGCGTGAFSDVILAACAPSTIVAFDPSRRHVDFARSRINDDRVQFKVGDATAIDARDGEFDVAAAALVLNFVLAPEQAVKEMRRVVRRGGTVAAYVWDFAGHRNISQHLMNAVSEIAPDAVSPSPALKSGCTTRKALAELFSSAGLEQIKTTNLDIAATFTDFEDYWTSNTNFRSTAANVCCSLVPNKLQAVQQRLRDRLPRGGNGKIAVSARALAVQGIVRTN